MMPNRLFFSTSSLLLFLVATLFISCQRRPDASVQWRIANEKAFNEYADSVGFYKASVDGSNAFIYMKKHQEGQGVEFPIETSRVMLHYEVHFITGSKAFIEGNFDSEAPQLFSLSRGGKEDLITGMRIGIQNMHQGDEAELIIPWHLGYGASRHDGLEAYTSLRYYIRLDSIIPETTP